MPTTFFNGNLWKSLSNQRVIYTMWIYNVDLQCRFYKVDSTYSTLAVDFVAKFNTPDPPKIESGSPLNELDLVEPLTMAS